MKYAPLVFGLVVLGAVGWRIARGWMGASVKPSWLADNLRREWGSGYEGVSIRFPIRKITNEAAQWQTHKLRKRA